MSRAGGRRAAAAAAPKRRALALLLGLLPAAERRRWWGLVPAVLVAALAEVAAAAAVWALLRAVAAGMAPGTAALPAAEFLRDWASLPPQELLALLAGLIAGKNLLLALVERRQASVASAAAAAVSTRLIGAYLHAPYVYLRREGSAAALHRVTLSVAEAFHLVIGPAIHLLGEVAVAVALLTVLALASPFVALAAALPIAVLVAAFLAATRGVIGRAGERYDATQARVTARLQEALRAHKEIRVLGQESVLARELGELQGEIASAREHVGTLAGLPRLLNETVFALGAIGIGVGLVRGAGSGAELLPLLGLWAYAGFRLLPTANRIAVNVLALRYGGAQAADLERAVAELEGMGQSAEAGGAPAGAPEPVTALRAELRAVALSFRWDGAVTDALQGIEVTIRRGEFFGVAGPSGAGKSTLLDLLLALMPPAAGDVLADGRSVFAAPRAWRRRLGYVPQEALLLADTVRRNVACGRDDGVSDRGRLAAALRLARLDTVVAALPEGVETRVGDGGAGLSVGERQRIAIARALCGEPDLLILDEPTSALDAATEAEIVATLRELAGPVTVVVASHRPAVLAACDRVAVLDGGRLVALGPPGEVQGAASFPGRGDTLHGALTAASRQGEGG